MIINMGKILIFRYASDKPKWLFKKYIENYLYWRNFYQYIDQQEFFFKWLMPNFKVCLRKHQTELQLENLVNSMTYFTKGALII